MDVSPEPLFRGEEVRGVSGFFLEVFFLTLVRPPGRLDVGGGVVTMKFKSGSEPVCCCGFEMERTVVKLARTSQREHRDPHHHLR